MVSQLHHHQQRRYAEFSVVLVLIMTSICSVLQHSSPLALGKNVTTACFFFPEDFINLGFSYQFNVARLDVHKTLSKKYSGNNTSLLFPAIIAKTKSSPEMAALITSTINVYKCDIVIGLSSQIFKTVVNFSSAILLHYPDVRFIENNPSTYVQSSFLASSLPSNLRGFGYAEHSAMFAAGAAAVAQTKTGKIAFLYPFANTASSVNAFYRGMQFACSQTNFTIRLHNASSSSCNATLTSIFQRSFSDPLSETVLASLFIERGFDVIMYWSDSMSITQVVAALGKSNTTNNTNTIFTIPTNTNTAGLIYGDTVLVSVMLTPSYILSEIVDAVIRNDTFVGVYENGVRTSGISHVSPRAERNASLAATAAQQSLVANYSLWCGGMTITNGSRLYEGCWTDLDWAGRVELEEGIISLGLFQKSTQCAAGTYASYNDVFALSCLPCPSGTYSTGAGEVACRVCPLLMIPNATQSGCDTVLTEKEAPVALIAALSVVLGSIFIASVVGAVTLLRRRQLRRRDPASLPPPRGPSVALLLITIDPTRSQPQWRQDLDAMCTVLDRLWAVVVPACFEHHGYVAASAGEVILLAAPCVEDGIRLAADIETGFAERSSSGVHVALRIIVTAGHTLVLRGVAIASVHQTATTPSLAGALSDRRASSAPANDVSFASSTDSGSSTGREQIRFVGTLVDSLISLSRSCVHPAPLLSSSSVVFLKIVAQGKDRDAQESFARVEEVWSRLFKSNESMVRLDDGHNAAFHSLGRVCWLYLEHGVAPHQGQVGSAPLSVTPPLSPRPISEVINALRYVEENLVEETLYFGITSHFFDKEEVQQLVVLGTMLIKRLTRLLSPDSRHQIMAFASEKLHLPLQASRAKRISKTAAAAARASLSSASASPTTGGGGGGSVVRVAFDGDYIRAHLALQLIASLDLVDVSQHFRDLASLHRDRRVMQQVH